ncbi:DUF6169 family protein [Dyadobacter sp. CY327]|uniref:DUF6169 family protein n=1 Tax=Dyadobacter sp. CY327 TaxID=2907301 RepID=UPI001F2D889C|nr:DUF6169 family protein [Dyadobacter sp. CY327]MCE7071927.1 DUF6169 family protein [Dyadobacter sp. CY327]
MPEESNLLNHYSFVEVNLSYNFVTDSGDQYSAFFVGTNYFEDYLDLNEHVVSFGFSPNERRSEAFFLDSNCNLKRRAKIDLRVRDTIFAIMEEFLTKFPTKSIVSICANNDARELCRRKLFKDWYKKASEYKPTLIEKYDIDLQGADTFYGYASLILRNDNPRHDKLRDAFQNLNNDLISKGY